MDEAQQSGEIAPARIIRTRGAAAATIAGRDAAVLFSGLTPGFVGLYQANVTLPSGTPSGEQDFVLTVNGVASNTVKIAVR
ncbi:MAG: hypothetical protein R2724_02005 [Bryobacterales bacterium]